MPPPPPPPPPPLLNNEPSKQLPPTPVPAVDRNALLSQIKKGTHLKKATTNDRSSPLVNGKSPTPSAKTCSDNSSSAMGRKPSGGPVGLGDLFAQGVPKLRPTNKSFLDGGAYKSQLSPRGAITKAGLGTSFNKARENVNQHFANQNLFKSVDIKSNKEPEANIKNSKSMENIASNNVKQAAPIVEQSFKSNNSETVSRGPLPPPPPHANKKPTFNTLPSRNPNVINSYLHKGDIPPPPQDPAPVIVANNAERARSSSKPLPLPKSPLVSSGPKCPPSKPNINLKPKSYDDNDIPNNFTDRGRPENSLEFPRGLKSLQNSSIPSNLHKLQNGSTQPRPLRQRKRPPMKPTTAPPPLPPCALGQQGLGGGSLNDVRQTQNTRELSVTAPVCYLSSTLPRPPPPPPRLMSQTCTMDRKRILPSVPKIQVPQGRKNDSLNQSVVSARISSFENRFASMYRNVSELPKPDAFSDKSKSYPSKLARANQTSRKKKARQPPPPAPPPPPPPMPIA